MVAATLTLSMAIAGATPAFSWQSNAHTVREDNGGRIIDYAIKMKRMERDRRAIRFDGRCDSACTLFLALPASNACVTPRARFGFHLPNGSSPKANSEAASFLLNSYPGWVRNWLQSNGGLTNQLKVMPYEFVRRHLGDCNTDSNSIVG
jgi:hypothetical protein